MPVSQWNSGSFHIEGDCFVPASLFLPQGSSPGVHSHSYHCRYPVQDSQVPTRQWFRRFVDIFDSPTFKYTTQLRGNCPGQIHFTKKKEMLKIFVCVSLLTETCEPTSSFQHSHIHITCGLGCLNPQE